MNASEYQKQAARTLIDDSQVKPLEARQHRIVWNALGLAGEAGEVLETTDVRAAITLSIQAGKLAEHVKKGVFHEQGLDEELIRVRLFDILYSVETLATYAPASSKLAKELGDVCWYAAAIASVLNISLGALCTPNTHLQAIFDMNIEKLKVRFPDGWDAAASAAKADELVV